MSRALLSRLEDFLREELKAGATLGDLQTALVNGSDLVAALEAGGDLLNQLVDIDTLLTSVDTVLKAARTNLRRSATNAGGQLDTASGGTGSGSATVNLSGGAGRIRAMAFYPQYNAAADSEWRVLCDGVQIGIFTTGIPSAGARAIEWRFGEFFPEHEVTQVQIQRLNGSDELDYNIWYEAGLADDSPSYPSQSA